MSAWLREHILRPLLADLQDMSSVEEADLFLAGLDERLDRVRPEDLEVRSFSDHLVRAGDWRPGREAGQSFATERWLFPVEMGGRLEMLGWWPDLVTPSVMPVGYRPEEEPNSGELRSSTLPPPLAHDPNPVFAQMTRHTFLLTPAFSGPPGRASPRVYVTLDLTEEEIGLYSKTDAISLAVRERLDYLREMCRAINQQTAAFIDGEARSAITEAARGLRERLSARASIRQSLSLDPAWKALMPRLEVVATDAPAPHDDASRSVDSRDLVAPGGQRLTSASFEDIQNIIGIWAQGVLDYPGSFAQLSEDQLSCLVTATLKATVPGADREVYHYGGKTDILIRAESLPDGLGSEPVFVCEAKKGSPAVAAAALEDQLLSKYMNSQDTAAVLLLYMTQLEFEPARRRVLEAVREVEGYLQRGDDEEKGKVQGWPVLTYARGGRHVRVCIATVHLPIGDSDEGGAG